MTAKTHEKLIEEIGNMSVFELSELVKALETTFGVTAAMPVAGSVASSEVPAAKVEEKTEYKVTLKDSGPEKIKTIKVLKQLTGLGLAEAKTAVESAPTVIAEAVSKDKATDMKQKLEEAGAKVELA